MKYDEFIDKSNMEVFHAVEDFYHHQKRYKCVLCGTPVSMGESFSGKDGHKIICKDCIFDKFPTLREAVIWLDH